jgi:hypothetical protein
MSARTSTGLRSVRSRVLLGALAVFLLAGVGLWLGLPGGSSGTPAPAAARTAPAPRVSDDPVASDPSLATAAPTRVPAAVVADVPQLPAHLPPVGLGQISDYGNGVNARLVSVTPVQATAQRRGELSGPALAVDIELTNTGSSSVALDAVGVEAYSGQAATPAVRMVDGATQPLHGTLEAGTSMTATYVFSVPTSAQDRFTVTVSFGTGRDAATAVFSGSVS